MYVSYYLHAFKCLLISCFAVACFVLQQCSLSLQFLCNKFIKVRSKLIMILVQWFPISCILLKLIRVAFDLAFQIQARFGSSQSLTKWSRFLNFRSHKSSKQFFRLKSWSFCQTLSMVASSSCNFYDLNQRLVRKSFVLVTSFLAPQEPLTYEILSKVNHH